VLLTAPEEPGPVAEAAQDLAGDLEKVFGRRPRIAHRPQDAGPVTVLIGFKSPLVAQIRPGTTMEPESFSISVAEANWSPGPAAKVILLSGADMRGTMFAVYRFAQEFLGIDPLYYWTDHEPSRRAQIELPLGLSRVYLGLAFRYRGFFINDEDMLSGWAPGAKKFSHPLGGAQGQPDVRSYFGPRLRAAPEYGAGRVLKLS
jgi:hypothetical protein